MPALTGSANYRRFFVGQLTPTLTRERILAAVRARRFSPATAGDMVSCGWASMTEPLIDEELGADLFIGDLITLGFRFDEKVLRTSDVRDEFRKRVKEVQRERGRRLSRQERAALKGNLLEEMRARAPVRRRVAELIWDAGAGEIRLFGATVGMARLCTGLFEATFNLAMEEANLCSVARRRGLTSDEVKAQEARGGYAFPDVLAARFLTWLWAHNQNGADVSTPRVSGYPGERVKCLSATNGAQAAFRGEGAAQSRELVTALRNNHLITATRFHVAVGETLITGNLDAKSLTLTGCKMPKNPPVPEDEDVTETGERKDRAENRRQLEDEARLLFRSGLLDEAQRAVDDDLVTFLRLTPEQHTAWEQDIRGDGV